MCLTSSIFIFLRTSSSQLPSGAWHLSFHILEELCVTLGWGGARACGADRQCLKIQEKGHSLNCNKFLIPSRPSAFWFPPNLRHAEGPRCWCVLCHLFIHDDRQLTQDISGPNCTPRFGPSVALGAFGTVLPWWQDWISVAATAATCIYLYLGEIMRINIYICVRIWENATHMPQIVLKRPGAQLQRLWRIASWAFESWNMLKPYLASNGRTCCPKYFCWLCYGECYSLFLYLQNLRQLLSSWAQIWHTQENVIRCHKLG